jgi:hypothetical protein
MKESLPKNKGNQKRSRARGWREALLTDIFKLYLPCPLLDISEIRQQILSFPQDILCLLSERVGLALL